MNREPAPRKTSPRILRLDWLEKQAQAYREIGETRGDTSRMFRAIRLEEAVNSQITTLVLRDVTSYR